MHAPQAPVLRLIEEAGLSKLPKRAAIAGAAQMFCKALHFCGEQPVYQRTALALLIGKDVPSISAVYTGLANAVCAHE